MKCVWAPYSDCSGVAIDVDTIPTKRGRLKISHVPDQDSCYAADLRKFLYFNDLTFDKTTGKCVNYQTNKVRLISC
jgi:hypothetical protein